MKRALILGCSHAAGAEMYKEPGLSRVTDKYGYTRSYPAKIAQALGYEVHNHAISGGSNDAMFRIFEIESQRLAQDDLVIACWTGDGRTEIWYEPEQRWLAMTPDHITVNTVTPSPVALQGQLGGGQVRDAARYIEFFKSWVAFESDVHRGRLNKLKNILAVNALAQMKNLKVINLNSFCMAEFSDHHQNIKDFGTWPVGTEEFCRWCLDRNFPSTDWGHFFEPAHQAFADHVLEQLTNKQE